MNDDGFSPLSCCGRKSTTPPPEPAPEPAAPPSTDTDTQ